MPNRNGHTTEEKDVGAMVGRAREGIEDVAAKAKKTLEAADRTLSTRMKENPILVLGIAVGVGYVIGRVFSRLS